MRLTRRSIIGTGLVAAASPVLSRLGAPLAPPANAQEAEWRHGVSLFDELKYPPGFKHFEYVNPNAPKGGLVRLSVIGTFDNFNLAVGTTRGSIAGLITELYDTLLVSSLDEISTAYGLLAEAAKFPPDFSSATFRLRPTARFHDGKPVTVADVIYSLDTFKKYDPQLAAYYRHVVEAKQTGEREVTFVFDGPGNRELPSIIGQLTVMPKHWWEGTDAEGKKRDVGATTLEPPLGNGAYRIKSFVPGRSLVYERVKDYWGKDVNVSIGRDNFDELRIEYFRDSTVALEAFKADQIDFRRENSALFWATRYDFPAVTEKRVVREEFDIRSVGVMQGMAFNFRRDKFKDPRVRRAFNFAYDFEEMNKQIFFGQYNRISSYFEGTELAWHGERTATGYATQGPPQGKELEILETVRGKVPSEVFTTPYTNPVGGNPEAVRTNLREATRLLREAGYEVRGGKAVNGKTGEPLSAEFLSDDPGLERIFLFYKPQLERLGITVTLRTVDNAQYENRLRQWDFDIIMNLWAQSLSPGNEQRDFWGSPAADQPGSRNVVGIKDAAVDALIERIIFAKQRDELVAATRALDRVLMWNHFVVPQYTYGKDRTVRWDRFGRPEILPKYGMSAFPVVWWWDAEKAAKTGSRQ